MISKFQAILRSVRFWQAAGAFVVMYLASVGYIDSEIARMVAGILGVSVTIGTVDRGFENFKR